MSTALSVAPITAASNDAVTVTLTSPAVRAAVQPLTLKGMTEDGSPIIAGYGVVFGDADLTGETFTKDTNFWFDTLTDSPPVLYQHGKDGSLGREVMGKARVGRIDEVGVWFEAQLDRANKYRDAIVKLVKEGKLGWSTGSAAHLVAYEGKTIKSWPVVELSLTPTPAEPRTLAQFVKDESDPTSTIADAGPVHEAMRALMPLHDATCAGGDDCPVAATSPSAKAAPPSPPTAEPPPAASAVPNELAELDALLKAMPYPLGGYYRA